MSEDLRHIVEQSFKSEETQGERTPEERRSETFEAIDTAETLLAKVKEDQGEESEFYQEMLQKYKDVQKQAIVSLPSTIIRPELNTLRARVIDMEKVVVKVSLIGKLLSKSKYTDFSTKEIEELETRFHEYALMGENPDFFIQWIENRPQFKGGFLTKYENLNSVVKNDTRIIQILLDNFESSIIKDSRDFMNLLPKEFKEKNENKIFLLKNAPTESLREKILGEILIEETNTIFISQILERSTELNIDKSKIIYKLSDSILQNKVFLEKQFSDTEINVVLKERGDGKTAFQYSLRAMGIGKKLSDTEIRKINEQINLYGTKGIEDMLLDIVPHNEFGFMSALHNDREFVKKLIQKTGNYTYINTISDELRNDMIFLGSIARNKTELEKLLTVAGVYITDNATISQIGQKAEQLGIRTDTLGIQFQDKKKILETYQKQEESSLQKSGETSGEVSKTPENPRFKETEKELQSAGFSPKEIEKITPREKVLISSSQEALENFIYVKETLEVLNLEDFWDERENLFKGAQLSSSNSGLDVNDSNYMSTSEFSLILYTILDSIDDKLSKAEKSEIQNLRGQKQDITKIVPLIRKINEQDSALAKGGDKSILIGEGKVERIYRIKYYGENEKLASGFNTSKFQDSLGN